MASVLRDRSTCTIRPTCIFCDARDRHDARAGAAARPPLCFVILNLYPYNNGHLMVVPNRHLSTLESLENAERNELMALTRLV